MTQNTMLTLRVSKHLRKQINAARRAVKPRKSQAQIVREALEAHFGQSARSGGAAAPQQVGRENENAHTHSA